MEVSTIIAVTAGPGRMMLLPNSIKDEAAMVGVDRKVSRVWQEAKTWKSEKRHVTGKHYARRGQQQPRYKDHR